MGISRLKPPLPVTVEHWSKPLYRPAERDSCDVKQYCARAGVFMCVDLHTEQWC